MGQYYRLLVRSQQAMYDCNNDLNAARGSDWITLKDIVAVRYIPWAKDKIKISINYWLSKICFPFRFFFFGISKFIMFRSIPVNLHEIQ